MKKIFFLAFLSLPVLAKSQTTVKGIFTEQNSGNKPIVGVQIKALGANPEVSDNSGMFQLVFGAKKPGDRIIVSEIKKKGYEIVNKKEVDGWIIGSNPNQRIKVVMCPEGLIAENTAKYYDISLKAVTDGYNKRINVLQEQLAKAQIDAKTYGEQAKTLSDQFTNQQNQLEELADKFARENFDDCSSIQKQAFESFKQGNVEEAIRILETVDSDAEIAKAKLQKSKGENLVEEGRNMQSQADSIIQQNVAKLMFQGDMYAADYRFGDAEMVYAKAVAADTMNFENILTYATFLYHQNLLEKEEKILKNSLIACDDNKTISYIYNFLGNIYLKWEKTKSATIYHDKAINICKKLANTYPDKFNLILASQLSDKATGLVMQEDYPNALTIYSEAKKLREQYMGDDTLTNKNELISILTNIGYILAKNDNFDDAVKTLEQASRISLKLTSINKIKYVDNFILTQNTLAQTLNQLGRLKEADSLFKNLEYEISILSKKNPQKYKEHYASILNNYAFVKYDLGEFDFAESLYLKSDSIFEDLNKVNPKIFKKELSSIKGSLSFFYLGTYKTKKALEFGLHAKKILLELQEENGEIYNNEIATILTNIGSTYISLEQYNEAINCFKETLYYTYKLEERSPGSFNNDISIVLNNLSVSYTGIEKLAEADSCLFMSLNITERLYNENPEVYGEIFVSRLYNYAYLKFKRLDFNKSEKYFQKCIDHLNAMAKSNPRIYLPKLYKCLGSYGFLKYKINEFDAAVELLNKSRKGYEQLALENPNYHSYLITIYQHIASCNFNTNPDSSKFYIDKGIHLTDSLKSLDLDLEEIEKSLKTQDAYYHLLSLKFEEAEKIIRKTYVEEADMTYEVAKNLAHSLLLQNKYNDALKYYEIIKNDTESKESALNDFNQFERIGIANPDFNKVRILLK